MAGLRALLGLFPNTNDFETKRHKLEEEFNSIAEFENSVQYKRYVELETYLHSEEFFQQKKKLLSLRYADSEEYKKEREFLGLKKAKDILLYYKTKDSQALKAFYETERSSDLERYIKLEELIHSPEFLEVKRQTSLSPGKKFAASELAKILQQYEQQKNSAEIRSYYKFVRHKFFNNYADVLHENLENTLEELRRMINSEEFLAKTKAMKRSEFKQSEEKKKRDEYKTLVRSKRYKRFVALRKSSHRESYEKLKGSDQLEAFLEHEKYVKSDDFKRRRKEIEKMSFKDTKEYQNLQEFEQLKRSVRIKAYFKFRDSKELKNYQQLHGSERIKLFEKLKALVESEEFKEKKKYLTESPKQRLKESELHKFEKEFDQLRKSKEIKWYLHAKKDKKFTWHRTWLKTFTDDFTGTSLDASKWITKYYWGDEILKDSYSLSSEKHYITDGKNLDIKNSNLVIITKKETVKGKSWHPLYGFMLREFGYTSGLVNTGRSFRQKYGTFEAKIKIDDSQDIQNAFWMVSSAMLPHINVAKANGKVVLGNVWGNAKDISTIKTFKKAFGRNKLSKDHFIYTLEWMPKKLIWKINGIEVARSTKGVPQEAMYMVLSAGLTHEPQIDLPAQMEVDWVNCYQHKNFLVATQEN